MPFTPKKTCTTAGCHRAPAPGKSKCTNCLHRDSKKDHSGGRERGYAEGWGREFLDEHPLCYHRIDKVCTVLAELPDHFPESRKELEARGVADPNDPRYLVPSCTPCHRVMTARRQPGGVNRPGWRKSA